LNLFAFLIPSTEKQDRTLATDDTDVDIRLEQIKIFLNETFPTITPEEVDKTSEDLLTMIKANEPKFPNVQPDKMLKLALIFAEFDDNHNGLINEPELYNMLLKLGHPVSEQEVHRMLQEVDVDQSGDLSFYEFLRVVSQIEGGGKTKLGSILSKTKVFSFLDNLRHSHGSLSNVSSPATIELSCLLCLSGQRTVVVEPCQHQVVCKSCAVSIFRCPVCDIEVKK